MDRDKSSAELQRDITETRHHADMVLTELEQRLAPDRLMEDVRHFFTDNPTGREMMANMKASVVRNPLPLVLTAIGIGWMMMEGMRARAPLHGRRSMQSPPLGRTHPLEQHHMHVEDAGRTAHPGRGPTAEEITGREHAQRAAAVSARSFENHGETEPLDRAAPTVLGPDGQPLDRGIRPVGF